MNVFSLLTTIIAFIWCGIFTFFATIIYLFTWSSKISMWLFRNVWATVFNAIIFLRVDVKGMDEIDFSEPYVLMSNHQSFTDIPAIVSKIKTDPYFLLKKELRFVPFVGWFAAMTGMIFIDRSSREKSLKSIEKSARLVSKGKSVLIFPEGTRGEGGHIAKFKKGGFTCATQANVRILPIVLEGTRNSQKKGGFLLKPAKVKMKFGTPISPHDFDKMEDLVEHTYQTILAMHKEVVREIIYKQ